MKNLHWDKPLFFLVFIPLFTFAQKTLTGRVLDDQSQPLYGATVIIKGSNNGTVTDAQGQFNLTTQRSFPIDIEVSYVGFDNLTFTIENDQPKEYQLSFSNRFDEIIVSASRKAEKLQEAPASVSVISAMQVTASGGAISPIRALINNPGDAAFPTHKIRLGLNYDPKTSFDASLNYQWDDGFKSNSPVFPGTVPAKNLVDITLGLKLNESLRFELAAINLLNNRFRALPSFPRLSRTVTRRLVMNLN